MSTGSAYKQIGYAEGYAEGVILGEDRVLNLISKYIENGKTADEALRFAKAEILKSRKQDS